MEIKPGESALKGITATRNLALEFRKFLLERNVLALAVGVVLGVAVGKVVDSIVKSLIMPVVGLITPSNDWRGGLNWKGFGFGDVLGTLLDFIIVAGVVFLITKSLIRSAPPAPTKACPECLEAVHPDAKRCKFCTSSFPTA
jgi:large conductance mechanosensitive channel